MAIEMAKSSSKKRPKHDRLSVADARDQFAAAVRRAEEGRPVEITRRGEVVAVLAAASARPGHPQIADLLDDWRLKLEHEGLVVPASTFRGLRDESPGREPPSFME